MNLTAPDISEISAAPDHFGWQHSLDDILDARLIADPRVLDFHRIPFRDSILSRAGYPPGSRIRTVRLSDRILTVAAIPEGTADAATFRRSFHNQPELRHLLLVSERYLRRRPHIDGAMLIAESAGAFVSPLARVLISDHLSECGGSSDLGDCAAYMYEARDPVQAVFALAAAKTITVDISRPITAQTRVYLPPR
ncbi:hypothetical protein ACXIUS_05130 [Bosea thiooxidans]|nr:hypothetical protein [Bosea sp. (in: a-proteobacteria)]